MRITVAGGFPYPSRQGSQVYFRGCVAGLRGRGHAVTTVTYGYGEGVAEAPHVGVPVPSWYRRLRSGPDLVKPFLDVALVGAIAGVAADVVFAHHVEALAAAVVARRWTGVPVVYACHTLLAEELPAYIPGLGWAGAVLDSLARAADAVVALSGRVEGAYILPGLAPEDFRDVHPRRLAGHTLVYAGNADAYQDLDVLFAAARLLPGWRLLVVTEAAWTGPAGAMEVQSSGWAETRAWIAGADVAAVPRAVCGGVPIKLLNALALGIPVVVSAGSARGLPGEVCVPDRDPAAFADGVRRALAAGGPDPARILALVDPDARAAELERVFQSVAVRKVWVDPAAVRL